MEKEYTHGYFFSSFSEFLMLISFYDKINDVGSKTNSLSRKIKICILILLFICLSTPLYAVEPNTSLFSLNKNNLITKYNKLLKTIKPNNNPDYNTQKTILHALINILSSKNKEKFNPPKKLDIKTQNDFLLLLIKIAKLHIEYENLEKKINKISKKLNTLSQTLETMDNSSYQTITYQLLYSFYKISLDKLNKKVSLIKSSFNKWNNYLYKAFKTVNFNNKSAKRDINKYIITYKKISEKMEKLAIQRDRLTLLSESNELNAIKSMLESLHNQKDKIAFDIANDYMLIYLYNLKNSKNLGKVKQSINRWISLIKNKNYKRIAENEDKLILYVTKRKIGLTKIFISNIKTSGSHIISSILHFISKPMFHIGNTKISILSIFFSILTFILGVYSGKEYKKRVKTSVFSKNMTLSTKTILANVGYYVIVLITLLISLKIIGINLSSLTVILGALSVGIGFGLQNMVSNFISGIILMLENSIRIGDYIEINDTLKGKVKDIQIRSTTIVTNDHIEVIIPNQTLFQNNVINWTLTEKIRRFRIPFSVAYGTDIDKVKEVVLGALKNSNLNYINRPGKEPEIKMISMNSSSLDFNLDVWVEGEDVTYPRRTTSNFLIMIYKALNENGITIPFPQLDIHVKDTVTLKKEE